MVVSTHLLLVSTQCFKAKAEYCRNGEVVSTLDQVDTLRKLCDLKSLLDTWHSRELVDRPWIMCPRPPRVLLEILGINTLLIGHPTTREPPRAFQKVFPMAERALLPVLASFVLLHPNSHIFKHKKRCLIQDEAKSDETVICYRCNKPGHMKGECPENKKEKYKKIHKFKRPKAMVATWSDEDSSEKEEEKSSSSESEEICFMENSSDG
ncbi:hypothetical protein Taro_052079, partial [Colocasia esculenta]|nr:hypothetical protein [Colocasia esculenta]